MEAVILIGIVILYIVYKGAEAVSEGVAQARISKDMERIRQENIATTSRLINGGNKS